METVKKIWNKKFILLFITNLLVLASFYTSIPIIPVYCQEIGITGSKVGIVLTAMSIATIIFRPVAGYLLDNFNRYRVYLLFFSPVLSFFSQFYLIPYLRRIDLDSIVYGCCLLGMRFCYDDTSKRCASILQDHRRYQPFCLYHFYRNGARSLCGYTSSESHEF